MAPGTGRNHDALRLLRHVGLSLIAALIIISMIWSRLAHYGTSRHDRVPTLWIVLGPLGQSMTVAGLLGTNAALAVPPDLPGHGHLRDPVGARCGLQRVVDRTGHSLTVRTLRTGNAVRADLWDLTFPVGDVRHWDHPAGHQRAARVRIAAVIAYAGC